MESLSGILAFVRTRRAAIMAAGAQLGISASAVGKSEARWRTAGRAPAQPQHAPHQHLTEEGELFLERCARIVRELERGRGRSDAGRQSPRGRLRVSLPAIGYRMLVPLLPEFTRRYPEIELDLDFSDRIVDLIGEGRGRGHAQRQLRDSREGAAVGRLSLRGGGVAGLSGGARRAAQARRSGRTRAAGVPPCGRWAIAGMAIRRRRKTPRRRCAPRWPSTMWRRWWAPPRPAWAWPMCRTSPCANCCMTASWSRPWRTGPGGGGRFAAVARNTACLAQAARVRGLPGRALAAGVRGRQPGAVCRAAACARRVARARRKLAACLSVSIGDKPPCGRVDGLPGAASMMAQTHTAPIRTGRITWQHHQYKQE